MRKSGRTCDEGERPTRRWIRGPIAAPANGPAPTKPAKPTPGAGPRTAKRFVEPYPYTEDQRAAITATLAADGVGDTTAREIFIGAIAYDLALLQAACAESSSTTSALTDQAHDQAPGSMAESKATAGASSEPDLSTEATRDAASTDARPPASAASLSDAARRLAIALNGLDKDQRHLLGVALQASDRFGRVHDDGYLGAIARELERIAEATASLAVMQPVEDRDQHPPSPRTQASGASPTATAATAPRQQARPAQRQPPAQTHPAALAFIRHAANVYEQCFDAPPSLKAQGPFAHVLQAIAHTTGVQVPSQARILKQAMGGD